MKIAIIGHKRIPSREGGIEIVVEELATRFVERGHEVHVFNRSGYHVSGKDFSNKNIILKEYKGVRIITIPTFQNSILNALVYSLLASLRVIFGRYDVIHYHAEGPSAMLLIPHLFGIRTIATIHGLDWQRSKWGGFASNYLKFGEKIAAKYADEVIVLSKNVQQYFFDTYGRVVNFIPNGIVKPEIKGFNVIYEKWGLNKDEYILYVGRIVPEKGVHYLIDAFKNTEISKKLLIVGGSSHTDKYMNYLKEKAKCDNRVIFTDFIQGIELEEFYSNAYLYVLPSDIEGMPISLLEAMSYGNCCLVSDIPECTEVVENRAFVFKKGEVQDLKDKLLWLVKNPQIVDEYKKCSSNYVCDKYKWDIVADQTIELYNKKSDGEKK